MKCGFLNIDTSVITSVSDENDALAVINGPSLSSPVHSYIVHLTYTPTHLHTCTPAQLRTHMSFVDYYSFMFFNYPGETLHVRCKWRTIVTHPTMIFKNPTTPSISDHYKPDTAYLRARKGVFKNKPDSFLSMQIDTASIITRNLLSCVYCQAGIRKN